MSSERKQRSDPHCLIILFILILAAADLSLNGIGERNPLAASPAAVQTTLEKTDSTADHHHSASCKDDKARIQNGLRHIFRDFQQSDSPKSIEVLVDLDSRIRALLESRLSYRPCEDDSGIYEPQWKEIGVDLGYWVDLAYSGRLLENAHKANPNSQLRRYTLFSTIFGTKTYHGLAVVPNIKAALTYASEFPDGPFAKQTLRAIADFHKDLFMVLRGNERDYKFDCYKPYITKRPIHTQRERARRTALTYYRKVLAIDPSDDELKALSNDVKNGTVKRWSFCSE